MFDFNALLESLQIMGMGLAGIFIVIGVIMGIIKLLSLMPMKK